MCRWLLMTVIVASAAGIVCPAAAQSSADAFSNFDGRQDSEGFTYGVFAEERFQPFDASGPCYITLATCLAPRDISRPEVSKSTSESLQGGDIAVPADQLLALPWSSLTPVYVAYTAGESSLLDTAASFELRNIDPHVAAISFFYKPLQGRFVITPISLLTTEISGAGVSALVTVDPGDTFGYIIGTESSYDDTAVGFNFVVSAIPEVPEPSSWFLMISGFLLAGLSVRYHRRRYGLHIELPKTCRPTAGLPHCGDNGRLMVSKAPCLADRF